MSFPRLAAMVLVTLVATASGADDDAFIVVLGVAQDAGYPQAACYRPHCMRAWEKPGLRRFASSIAVVDRLDKTKYVFDATPDFREQLYALHKAAPDGEYTLGGIFLTHGHMGHYTGLMHLGHEASGSRDVPVYAMPRMREYLANNGPWSQLVDYQNIRLLPIDDGRPTRVSGRLSVTPLRVPHREEYTEAVGFLIEGPAKKAVFIPDIDKWERWDTDIRDIVRSVDYAFLDATFFSDGEIPGRSLQQIPHPFVSESMQLLSELSPDERQRVIFIHMNHSNPLLIEGSPAQQMVRDAGFRFATEGMRLAF